MHGIHEISLTDQARKKVVKLFFTHVCDLSSSWKGAQNTGRIAGEKLQTTRSSATSRGRDYAIYLVHVSYSSLLNAFDLVTWNFADRLSCWRSVPKFSAFLFFRSFGCSSTATPRFPLSQTSSYSTCVYRAIVCRNGSPCPFQTRQ